MIANSISDLTKQKQREHDQSESDEDFSESASEFEPSSSESEANEASGSGSEEDAPLKKPVNNLHLKTPSSKHAIAIPPSSSAATIRRSQRLKTNDYQYILQSDDYFTNQSSHHKTSDHTMDRLKTPRLQQDQLMQLLSEMTLSEEHQKAIKEMHDAYTVKIYTQSHLKSF